MRRHPLLWKLALLQVSFCLLLIWLIWTWGLSVERSTYFLSQADQDYLARYAQQAEDAWNQGGAVGAEAWRRQLEQAEDTWVAVIGPHLQSLGTTPLSAEVRFSLAGLAYALVAGITVYAAGHLHRRVSMQARMILSRIAGILLTAIAVTLLANGGTQLVVLTLRDLGVL